MHRLRIENTFHVRILPRSYARRFRGAVDLAIKEGDMGICGAAVLMFFWCGDTVSKVSICGVAVISNLTVCDVCVFHAAVFGEMKLFAVLWFLVWSFQKLLWWSHFLSSTGRNQIAPLYYAGLGFGLRSCSATAKSAPLALISANFAENC